MAKRDSNRFLVAPGSSVRLADIDTSSTAGAPGDRAATTETFAKSESRLYALHDRLWAEKRRAVLLVLQGMDTSGKDGAIKHVVRGLNPEGVRVASFKAPTERELAHDFLWRVHSQVPDHGELGVFNRSHYEDVVIVRVHDLVPKRVWKARFDHINAFESLLVDSGTAVVKVFLHISKDEQAARLRARLDDPEKRWKFNQADLAERERWDDYQVAYEEAIERTATKAAPWFIVPADHKWYRNWALSRILIDALVALDPHYPAAAHEVEGAVVT